MLTTNATWPNVRRERCVECETTAQPSVVTLWVGKTPIRFCPKCAIKVADRLKARGEFELETLQQHGSKLR